MTRHIYILVSFCMVLHACSSAKKITNNGDGKEQTPVVWSPNVLAVNNANNVIEANKNKEVKEKYAKYLNISPHRIINIKLYTFIDRWLNTPYKWGGTDERGIDCSAFTQRLLNEVYDLQIPRTSIQQLHNEQVELFRSTKYLSEGDILFFKMTNDKVVSHVGIYLDNYMFVNCSSSQGVSIASLKDIPWKRCLVAAGRVKVLISRN